MRAADELIDRIVNSSHIPSGKRRREIQRELRGHIEDLVVAEQAAGRGQGEIEEAVLANFGDPGQIARSFAWVYRHERRAFRAFVYVLSTLLLASSVLAAILATQAGLAFGFGTPVMRVVASRHTVIEALDILASVAAYLGVSSLEKLFENYRLPKAALLLATIVAVIVAACATAGLYITFLFYGLVVGLFFRAVQVFVTAQATRLGVVAICFALAGLVSAMLRSPGSNLALAATCASWLAMGAGYQLMTHIAPRVDAALLDSLQRD